MVENIIIIQIVCAAGMAILLLLVRDCILDFLIVSINYIIYNYVTLLLIDIVRNLL